jgi:hypothetical protein
MKMKLLLCLALVLSGGFIGIAHALEFTNSPALTNSEQNFQSLVKLVEQKQFYPARNFYWQQKGVFSQDQRNAFFLSAAESLVMTNEMPENKARTILAGIDIGALEFMGSLLGDHDYIREGISYKDHGITTSEAIPCLIEGLQVVENEDPRFIDQHSGAIINTLWCLTRRNTGFVNGNDHFFERNHEAVISWWWKWWQENKDRHPVFDANLEIILRDEVLKIDEKIRQAKPTPDFHWDSSARFELEHNGNFYSGNEWNGGPKNSVFMYDYGHMPGNIAMGGGYFPERGADVLYIHGEFLTEWLPEKSEPIYGTTFSGQKFPMQNIFSETVKGTGIAIKVQITTTNTALIKILREKLKE